MVTAVSILITFKTILLLNMVFKKCFSLVSTVTLLKDSILEFSRAIDFPTEVTAYYNTG